MSTTKPEVLVLGGARTPMTDYVGALRDISALELGAIAARGAFERTGVKPEWVDHASSAMCCRPALTPSTARGTWRSKQAFRWTFRQGIAAIVEVI